MRSMNEDLRQRYEKDCFVLEVFSTCDDSDLSGSGG